MPRSAFTARAYMHEHVPGKWGFFCDAFPDGDGISDEVVYSQVDHRTEAVLGDHGLHFVPKSAQPADDAARRIGDMRAFERAYHRSRFRLVK